MFVVIIWDIRDPENAERVVGPFTDQSVMERWIESYCAANDGPEYSVMDLTAPE